MTVHSKADIQKLIEADPWMMSVLRAAAECNLSDWWIGAGFLRNKVWDAIEGKTSKPTRDVDLVYFNCDDVRPETDWTYDDEMKARYPFAEWEIRNQARMNYVNKFPPFTSTADGIAHWVETATCVAVRLEGDRMRFLFCYGTDDLFNLIARPTPYFTDVDHIGTFQSRVKDKQWHTRWPHLRVIVEQFV